ncbi:FUSC family protein, partial [Francisella tularensis subsp. holarctica]|nr:FUSC family protein [Francisella tularensis subsp. holarctica]
IFIGRTISQRPLLVPDGTFIIGALTVYQPKKFKLMPEIITKFCFIVYISSNFGHIRVNQIIIIKSATKITNINLFYY